MYPSKQLLYSFTGVLQACYKNFTRKSQGCYRIFRNITAVIQGWYWVKRGVLRVCSRDFEEMFKRWYRGVTEILPGCYKVFIWILQGVTGLLQWSKKGFIGVLQGCCGSLARMFLGLLHRWYNNVTGVLQACCMGVTRILYMGYSGVT